MDIDVDDDDDDLHEQQQRQSKIAFDPLADSVPATDKYYHNETGEADLKTPSASPDKSR